MRMPTRALRLAQRPPRINGSECFDRCMNDTAIDPMESQADKRGPSGSPSAASGGGKPASVSKPFMALGPTLHYSHKNVQICWLLGVLVFSLACLLWSKVTSGSFWSPSQLESLIMGRGWHLHRFIIKGISVYEYPWQIPVLGLLMGLFGIVPILTAQLLSFSHSLPFIGAVMFLANLPGIAITLLLSCVGVACRPLRFRSRIIAIALCMAPLLAYWGYFGGGHGQDPISWGISFAPWITAWLLGLIMASTVLGIGHITRYRPGLIWTSTAVVFLLALIIFESKIGFDELAFQLYVSENNPEEVPEFHPHSVTEVLDETIKSPQKREFLAVFFYPSEPIPLREELKREMQVQLSYDRWPSWVDEDRLPSELRFQDKRKWLLKQYDYFINPPKSWWMPGFLHEPLRKRRASSPRMAIALYYRAILLEQAPNPLVLGRQEVLMFYNDHPLERARETWQRLYAGFTEAPEVLEAYWRIAKHWAGSGRFEDAQGKLQEARQRAQFFLDQDEPEEQTLFSRFQQPATLAITRTQLLDRVDRLASLIGPQNRSQDPQANSGLATFVMLNPYALDYEHKLETLLQQLGEKDRLRDNVLLAQAKLIADQQDREGQLSVLHDKYMGSDGGREALYELALLRVRHYQSESDPVKKNEFLAEARKTLTNFVDLYQDSIFTARVEQILVGLPEVE